MGVYLGQLQCELTFPLDEDLIKIVRFYDLPLRRFTPISILCIVGFMSLTRLLKIPFSITLFCLIFRAKTLPDGFVCIGAHNHREFLKGL